MQKFNTSVWYNVEVIRLDTVWKNVYAISALACVTRWKWLTETVHVVAVLLVITTTVTVMGSFMRYFRL